MMSMRFLFVLIVSLVQFTEVAAQQRPASPRPSASAGESAELARGWQLLAQGRANDAEKVASDLLATTPRSGAALSLALDAAAARGGSSAALTFYERWLAERKLEEPAAVRRIARALLVEIAGDKQQTAARTAARHALARDGDRRAQGDIESERATDSPHSLRALAAAGDEAAVRSLTSGLETAGAAEGVLALEALGASGNRDAAAPIAARLADQRSEIRGAAAEALGRLGAADYVGALRELLNDRSTYVRLKAAGALARIGDDTGDATAREFVAHESAAVRLAAADAMAPRPTDEWKAMVRSLLSAQEAEVQIGAARLLAPHEPELAFKVLQGFASNSNPVVRDLAARALGDVETSDLTTLRRLLKTTDPAGKVRAAARVLAITR